MAYDRTIPPVDTDWHPGTIERLAPDPNGRTGTWTGEMQINGVRYFIRSWEKVGGEIKFEFQAMKDPEHAKEMLDYLDGKTKRMAG